MYKSLFIEESVRYPGSDSKKSDKLDALQAVQNHK